MKHKGKDTDQKDIKICYIIIYIKNLKAFFSEWKKDTIMFLHFTNFPYLFVLRTEAMQRVFTI